MRSTTSLLASLFAFVALQTPTAEASHKKHNHNTACKHGNTVVARPGYSNKHQHHKHSSASVVIVTSTPSPTNYTYYPYYGYRRHYYTNQTPTYSQPPQVYAQPKVTRPENTRVRELGARFIGGGSIEGEQTALVGAGAYLRLRNTGRYLGFEASIDSTAILDSAGNAIANQIPLQAAALLYLNPQAPLRVFGLAGGGVVLEQSALGTSQGVIAQIGGGLDLDFAQRATLTLDVRGIASETTSAETRILTANPIPNANAVMNMGISLKF